MSMVYASRFAPAHAHRRPLSGLRGVTYAMNDTSAPEGAPLTVELGRPYALGATYAKYPLATLLGLISVGLGLSAVIQWFAMRRRR